MAKKVGVIGAGISGLVAGRELQREGHEVIIYEKGSRIGGAWVYDPEVESDSLGVDPERKIVHSSLYHSLRTNLPREIMSFSDYHFDVVEDPRTFPSHEEVLKFIGNFADEFGLVELVRFNEEVIRVEKLDYCSDSSDCDYQWILESRNGEINTQEMFDAVVVCNGHFTQPRLANLPGNEKWPGKQMHSHNYRVPEPFDGQIVVIIGAGPSAADISRDIATLAKQVYLSSRSPNVQVSKLAGYTNIYQQSKIECVNEDGSITFQDGFSVHVDIIIHCTGYKYNFPFLNTNGIVTIDENRVGPLYKHVFSPQLAPTLCFIGIPVRVIFYHMVELQAKWIAYVLSGKLLLPSKEEMLADIEHEYKQMNELGIPKHHTHVLNPFEQFGYLDWLAAQVGSSPPNDQLKDVFRNLIMYVVGLQNRHHFRDGWDAHYNLYLNEEK